MSRPDATPVNNTRRRRDSGRRTTVAVLGPHSTSGASMHRYVEVLRRGYADAGIDPVLYCPPSLVSRLFKKSKTATKYLSYVDKFLIFPITFPVRLRRHDLVHVADHSDALWLLLAFGIRTRSIVTCHDLFAVKSARGEVSGHELGRSGRIYQRLVLAGLRRARAIACISEATRIDVTSIVESVTVHLPNPISPSLEYLAAPPSRKGLLLVSNSGWRKRRGLAVAIWDRLSRTTSLSGTPLTIVGPPMTEEEISHAEELGVRDVKGRLRSLENLSDGELAFEYARAQALVVASSHEGFCWPVVEAGMNGTPSVCADIPVLREVAGAGGRFVPSEDPVMMSDEGWEEMARSLLSPETRRAARANADRYAHREFSARLAAIVQEVISELGSERGTDKGMTL